MYYTTCLQQFNPSNWNTRQDNQTMRTRKICGPVTSAKIVGFWMGTVASMGAFIARRRKNKKNKPLRTSQSAPDLTQDVVNQTPEERAPANPAQTGQKEQGNKRTAVILGTFMEEFQTLADEIPDIVSEQVAPNLKKHPMIQGIYCFVRDSESERDHLNSERINYPEHSPREQSNIGLPVLGLSQASLCKIKSMVNECVSKLPVWLTVNVRNDPCLFSKVDDDWLPYAVREYQRIQQTISEQHLTGKELDNFEVGIRRGVLDILKALREQSFYFYDDITFFENQPVTRNASHADYLLVSEEVYSNVILNQPSLRYLRLNFPYRQFPLEEEVDLLISVVREMCLEVLPGNLPGKASEPPEVVTQLMGFLITGRKLHDGTVQLGMAMAHLILRQLHVAASSLHQNADLCNMFEHKPTKKLRQAQSSSEPKENGANVAGKPVYKKRSECQLLNPLHQRIKAGKFQFIRQVGRYLPFMVQIKEEVDIAIDDCAEVINIREEILETTLELEAILFSTDSDKKILKTKLRANLMDQMERYYMLVCFNAYLRDQTAKRFSLSFTEWMRKHPKLYQVLVYLDVTEWFTTVDLIKQGNRILLSQNAIMSDELCTRRTTGLSNFRQLVGWPIYGASQPDIATVKRIHRMVAAAYWDVALKGMRVDDSIPRPDVTDSKRVPISMPCMIWVCLRNEYVIGCGDNMYAWRVKEAPMEPVVLKGISGPELEEYEDRFVESIQKLNITCTPLRLDFETDAFVPENAITLTQAISTKEMFKRAFSSDTDPANLTTSEGQSSGIPESYAKYVEQHAEYHRVCVSASGLPSPAIFDQILRLVVNNARGLLTSTITAQSLVDASAGVGRRHVTTKRQSTSGQGSSEWHVPSASAATLDRIASTNLIFFCETGRERTSLAMTIAGLVYCHLVGFSFGYRVDEEERISLRDAKYTKGEFDVIERLVRRIPNGNQVKREVDYVLDKCFDSMSMMHFHIREEIYFSYARSRDEKDPVKKEEHKRKSLAFLEEYFYLILFNMYLHDCQATRWKHSFEVWMEEVTKKCNYMELLDNFGFPEFEQIDALGRLRTRWRPHVTADSNFNGVY